MKKLLSTIAILLLALLLGGALVACDPRDKSTDATESGSPSMALADVVLRFVKAGYYIGDVWSAPEDEREEGELWWISASKGEEDFEAWLYETNEQATAASADFFSYFGEMIVGAVCGLRDGWLYCGTEDAVNIFLGQESEKENAVPAAFVDAVEKLLRAGYAFDIINAEDAEEYSFEACKELGDVEDFLKAVLFPSKDKAQADFDENRTDMEETYAGWESNGSIILKQEGRWVYAGTEAALRVIGK